MLGSTVTNTILRYQLIVEEYLVIMLVPIFDGRRCREREEDAFLEAEFRVVLHNGLVFE